MFKKPQPMFLFNLMHLINIFYHKGGVLEMTNRLDTSCEPHCKGNISPKETEGIIKFKKVFEAFTILMKSSICSNRVNKFFLFMLELGLMSNRASGCEEGNWHDFVSIVADEVAQSHSPTFDQDIACRLGTRICNYYKVSLIFHKFK